MKNQDDDYPVSEALIGSAAQPKPDERIVCRRCPNADWLEEFKDVEYGEDISLRAYCSGLGGRWIWPDYAVSKCQARTRAIKAERDQ